MNDLTVETNEREIPLADVIFRKDLYPRIEHDPITIQKYAEDLEVLPPIEVNQHFELIDGFHRWTAHRKAEKETIRVVVTPTESDDHLLELAIERNARHGLQLSNSDKKEMAIRIYLRTRDSEKKAKKKTLAKLLSVHLMTVNDWLSRTDKESKAKRAKQIFDLWLACYTQNEISDWIDCPQKTIDDEIASFSDFKGSLKTAKTDQNFANHEDEHFEIPIYNIWKQQEKTPGLKHFGNSEIRWLDNLLYLYTKPFDIVVDPFAGGGSTIDLCKRRSRRYLVSDRKVSPENEGRIRQHDCVLDGILKPPQWKDVALVYLDPPYWKQAEGQYSQDPTDLANMDMNTFNSSLAGVINGYIGKIPSGARVALIIQPTQWKAPGRIVVDHIADMLRSISKGVLEARYSVPYESQQCNAQMVEWAKENKQCLVLTREIVVWRKP